jgi:hypothetical protein
MPGAHPKHMFITNKIKWVSRVKITPRYCIKEKTLETKAKEGKAFPLEQEPPLTDGGLTMLIRGLCHICKGSPS